MGIDRNNAILNMMYRGTTTIDQFNWDMMTTVPIGYLISPQEINYIKDLILSPRYSGNNKFKMEKIDEIMHFRGFTRFAGGTNRLVYTHPSAPNAVFKVAIDSVGINDNPAEFRNQKFLKPYCCKVFECSPCGTIASFEKVDRITTFEEFYTIADDYYYIIVNAILGKYVMDDIGIDFFMNFGIRVGFGPVILDFPYLFELDGRKLECNNVLDDGRICHGEIDYDGGFNKLICKKCGRHFKARDLAKPPEEGGVLLRQKGGRRMKLEILRGDKVIKTYDTTIERDYLSRNDRDVTNTNLSAKVILERVPVVVKKTVTHSNPVNYTHNDGYKKKVVNDHPKDVKTGVKYITIDPTRNEQPMCDTTSGSDHIVQVIMDKKIVKTSHKPIHDKAKDTNTHKVVTGPKTEVEHLEKPIVGRVINVSIDKPTTGETVVPADTNTSGIDIQVIKAEVPEVVTIKKPKHIERINSGEPIVTEKKEEPAKKVVKTIEINVESPSEKAEEEKAPEISDDSKAVADEYQKIVNGEDTSIVKDIDDTSVYPNSMKTMDLNPPLQQAVFFGDEPGGYDPSENKDEEAKTESNDEVENTSEEQSAEETSSTEVEDEHHDHTDSTTSVKIGGQLMYLDTITVIDSNPEYDVNLILDHYNEHIKREPKNGELVIIHHVVNPETKFTLGNGEVVQFDKDYDQIYVCTDAKNYEFNVVKFDEHANELDPSILENEGTTYDNSGKVLADKVDDEIVTNGEEDLPEIKAEETESNDEVESTSEEQSVEDSKEDEGDEIVVCFKKPSNEEAEDDVFYCLPRNGEVDMNSLEGVTDATEIDDDLFAIYFKVDGEVTPIMYEFDSENWVVDDRKSVNLDQLLDEYSYEFCDELPKVENAEENKYYLLRTSDEGEFDAFTHYQGADKYHYCFHVREKAPKSFPKKDESKTWESAKSDEADAAELIANMKATSKKVDPMEYLKPND